MISHLDQIRNPVGLAKKFLASRLLLGGPDSDELEEVCIEAIISAALSWKPDGGRSITSWAYLYMHRDIERALPAMHRNRAELGREQCVSESSEWFDRRSHWAAEYDRVEARVDLQRWADLAELSDFQRFCVEYYALHYGVYVRDTALADQRSPLNGSGSATVKGALRHMRNAAVTGQRRDDRWTRRREGSQLEAKSAEAVAFWRNELNRPLIDRSDAA